MKTPPMKTKRPTKTGIRALSEKAAKSRFTGFAAFSFCVDSIDIAMYNVFMRTLEKNEERALLRATLMCQSQSLRDHIIVLIALKTGLRQKEICDLNVGDLFDDKGKLRRAVDLKSWKRSNDDASSQFIFLVNEELRRKLERYYREKKRMGHDLGAEAPLLISRMQERISTRQVRTMFTSWQRKAEIRKVRFHDLRHTAISNCYLKSRDPAATQRFARHKSPDSTSIYIHVSDERLAEIMRDM